MNLLVDAGNTRVKWALARGGALLDSGTFPHPETEAAVTAILRNHRDIRRIVCANVTGPRFGDALDRTCRTTGLEVEWLRSGAFCCGVRNGYDTPAQLGSDRWAGMIGARAIVGSTCIVVTAGTATTIDLLDHDGSFVGGVILPGYDLMRASLAERTAQLPLASGHYQGRPRNTEDAIISGCLRAQAGAVTMMHRELGVPAAPCILSGGAADLLEPLLELPVRREDNLVLRGLAVIAAHHARIDEE